MEFIKRILLLSVIALLGGGNLALAQQQNNDFRTGPVTEPVGETYKNSSVADANLSKVTVYRAAEGRR